MQAICGRSLAGVRVPHARAASTTMLPAPGRMCTVTVEAAVPKKKVSKSKTAIRKAAWKAKAEAYVPRALHLAKLALKEGNRESADKDMSSEAPKADSQ